MTNATQPRSPKSFGSITIYKPSGFEKAVEDFSRYYVIFNNSYYPETLEHLAKKEENLKSLRKAIDEFKENKFFLVLKADNKKRQIYEYVLNKADDYYESCKAFIELREKLLYPTKEEVKALHDAYDTGWNDYREIIFNYRKIMGVPISMEEIIDWGPEWYDIGPLEDG